MHLSSTYMVFKGKESNHLDLDPPPLQISQTLQQVHHTPPLLVGGGPKTTQLISMRSLEDAMIFRAWGRWQSWMRCSWTRWMCRRCAWSAPRSGTGVAACRPRSPTAQESPCWGRREHTAGGTSPAARNHSCFCLILCVSPAWSRWGRATRSSSCSRWTGGSGASPGRRSSSCNGGTTELQTHHRTTLHQSGFNLHSVQNIWNQNMIEFANISHHTKQNISSNLEATRASKNIEANVEQITTTTKKLNQPPSTIHDKLTVYSYEWSIYCIE